MVLTTVGKINYLYRNWQSTPTKGYPYYMAIGAGTTAATVNDTELVKPLSLSPTTIDDTEVVTGWAQGGDGGAVVVDNTAGDYKHGSACLTLPTTYSTGTSTWSKTESSADLSSSYIYLWYYISSKSTYLTNDSAAVRIVLGTGGYTNINNYDTSYANISDGWNLLVFDVNEPTSTGGSGATESGIDSFRIQVKNSATVSGTNQRMDYWHSGTYTSIYKTIESTYPTFNDGTLTSTAQWLFSTAVGNGYEVGEVGVFNTSYTMVERSVLSPVVSKDAQVRLLITSYDTIS